MKLSFLLFGIFLSILFTRPVQGQQSMLDGKFTIKKIINDSVEFTIYDFSRAEGIVKAKYFAENAYRHFLKWEKGKQILLVTAGSIADTAQKIIGLCVDNGTIINKKSDPDLDAMVFIYNNGPLKGGIAVSDMEIKPVQVFDDTATKTFWPRKPKETSEFLKWAQKHSATLFQSRLFFSSERDTSLLLPAKAIDEKMRFLILAKNGNTTHHIIVDAPNTFELTMLKYVKTNLEQSGYELLSMFQLQGGISNLYHALQTGTIKNVCDDCDGNGNFPSLLIYYSE